MSPSTSEHGQQARTETVDDDALLDRLAAHPRLAELIHQVVRTELGKAAPPEPSWTSKADAARRGFPAPSTLRAWQGQGLISRGRRGRVHLGELRRFLAQRGADTAEIADLEAERARRVAAEVLGPHGGRTR